MYEDFSLILLNKDSEDQQKEVNFLLSFEFYILSGRFNIQQIIDVYLEPMLN